MGWVATGETTPLILMLIGAPQEINRSEACLSAIILNNRSRYISVSRAKSEVRPQAGYGGPWRSCQCHELTRITKVAQSNNWRVLLGRPCSPSAGRAARGRRALRFAFQSLNSML